jgi:two-component system, NtrC family, nitrogen regulation sensor histidine kinase NtrY
VALTVPHPTAQDGPVDTPPRRRAGDRRGRAFFDNTKLILLGIAGLVGTLAGLLALANRSASLAPDFLAEFVLYALSATDLTILVALVFVLARNIVKLVVERRHALPFARFRAKLVAALLGMTIIPAVLVLIVGSELIRNSVDRWFNAPMEQVLTSAQGIAADYYQEQQRVVSSFSQRLARRLGPLDLAHADAAAVQAAVRADEPPDHVELVEVFAYSAAGATPSVRSIARMQADGITTGTDASSAALAERAATSGAEARTVDSLASGAELIRSARPIRASSQGAVRGVVIASHYLPRDFVARARGMTSAFEGYQQLRVLKGPVTGVYVSFFLMLTLMILVGATWMGLYMAKRITRPVQLLATAAHEIGAGRFDYRVEVQSHDEFGSLAEAFNVMAGELATSRERLERSAVELERTHRDVEGRRRYVETVLERIASGVVSVDAAGRIRTANSAARRLLGLDSDISGQRVTDVFGAPALAPLGALLADSVTARDARPQDVSITREGRELHLAVVTSPLRREDGGHDGVVLVFDDISPLIRAQKVAAWREVARRLAHEIKNPLTPIQLSAERLRRHFGQAPEPTKALVEECASTIIGEVESLKGLVDEFSQFARMPAPRAVPTEVHELLDGALALYDGLLPDITLERRYGRGLPRVSVDPEQMRRVILNLVDNAVEAMHRSGTITISTEHDRTNNLLRIVVADDGPGIPLAERDKLFLPYYSTKQRGSGLGLAIVRRIVAEHGGAIDVADNAPPPGSPASAAPRGTRFVIELPC